MKLAYLVLAGGMVVTATACGDSLGGAQGSGSDLSDVGAFDPDADDLGGADTSDATDATDADAAPSDGSSDGSGAPDLDTDDDGLPNDLELSTGTDPENPDTDGDGLQDGDEDRNANGTVDACDPTPPLIDADGDGALDLCETDPRVADSDGDGTSDGAESLPQACVADTEPASFAAPLDDIGVEWQLSAGSSAPVAWTGALTDPADAFWRLDASGPGVAGAIGSIASTGGDPVVEIDALALQFTAGLRRIDRSTSSWTTPSGELHASTRVTLLSGARLTPSGVRDRIAQNAHGISTALPPEPPVGTAAARFVMTLTLRGLSDGRLLYVVAVQADPPTSDAQLVVSEWTGMTGILPAGATAATECYPVSVTPTLFAADFLWVVDDTPSMVDDRALVADTSTRFFDSLASAGVDYRVGVVSTQLLNEEWFVVEPGFSALPEDFDSQLRSPPRQSGPPGSEFSLRTLQNVYRLAESSFAGPAQRWRADARRIIILFSDEDDATTNALGSGPEPACDAESNPALDGCSIVEQTAALLQDDEAVAYAITGDLPDGCTSADGPGSASQGGAAYIALARLTGGLSASICSESLGDTVDAIVRSAFGAPSEIPLRHAPVLATLRVLRNGVPLPRSVDNGWDYDVANNRVVFRGSERPDLDDSVAVGYRRAPGLGAP
jgi:hypothetical protein